jgi:hypothetical protein
MQQELYRPHLDYSRPVLGHGNFTTTYRPDLKPLLDITYIDSKYHLWDYNSKYVLTDPGIDLKTNKVIDHNKAKSYWKAISLLRDKSIYAYANFKFNDKPMRMRWYQDLLLNDNFPRILYASSNQSGKSITLDVDAAIEFSKDHDKEWVGILVSKSLPQSQYQMDRIKQLLKSGNFEYRVENTDDSKTGKKDNSFQISFTFYSPDGRPIYTNRLICCPPTGSALGYPCDCLWLDEFDFWKDIDQNWFIKQIAIPRTFETRGSIKIFTNPDGKKELWNLWNEKDQKGNPVWHRYNFNYWDTPNASQDDFDFKSVGMTRSQIESTLLAIFSNSDSAFFSDDEIRRSYDSELTENKLYNKQPIFFLDVGAKHDQSVLIGGFVEPDEHNPRLKHFFAPIIQVYPVGYPLSRVIGSEVSDSDGWHHVKSVKDYLSDWSIDNINPIFGVDCTGNSGIVPLCRAHGINPIDVTMSGPVKSGMYQRYKYLMEKGLLHRTRSVEFEYQASHLEMKKSARGYLMIHHAREDDLDDTQDAMAGFIYLADNPNIFPVTMTLIERNDAKSEPDKNTQEIKKKTDIDNYYARVIRQTRQNNYQRSGIYGQY